MRGSRPEVGLMVAMPQNAAGKPHAARGVAAQSEGRAATGDQRRLAAARPAGSAPQVVRIAGSAEHQVVALEGEQQVGQIGARDRDRPRLPQSRHQRGIFGRRRRVTAPQRARGASRAGDLDGILNAERHAAQRSGVHGRVRPRATARRTLRSQRESADSPRRSCPGVPVPVRPGKCCLGAPVAPCCVAEKLSSSSINLPV